MNLLVVDDEKLIRNVIIEYAKSEGFNVVEAIDGIDALNQIEENKIGLIILDIMMPNMDGLDFLKQMKQNYDIPVIILSARGEEYDKLVGFDLKADDYIIKPFSPKELMARIKAVLNRCHKTPMEPYIYQDLKIDYNAHCVYIKDRELKLTPKEYEILAFFVQNENIAVSREQLLNKLWGYDFYGDDRTVDTHIKMLRNNLGIYRDLIITVRGVGYKYVTQNKEE